MRRATRIVASLLGIFAGFGGPEHGYFEILQGNVRPDGVYITAMGPPCDPQEVWNLCEPALTVIPSFLWSGIVASIIGIFTMIWAAAFVHKRHGGWVLLLLCVALLLTGGGIFPPVIGIIAALVATRINVPLSGQRPPRLAPLWRFLARLWPWPLVAFFAWALGQFVVGYYFNDFLMSTGFLIPILFLGLLILSILTGHARDLEDRDRLAA